MGAATAGAGRSAAGRSVRVRAIAPADDEPLRRFYADLSDESRALRFLGPTPCLGPALANAFCRADHEHREGFVAVLQDSRGPERIVGHLCVEPFEDGETAEVAVAVADAMQRQGIGRELIRRTHEAAGLNTTLILLSAPKAVGYYPHIGMQLHPSCWIIPRKTC